MFGFVTRGDMDRRVDGGYKFAGCELFGLPLDFTYFVDEAGSFGTGSLLPEVFGKPPLASRYLG